MIIGPRGERGLLLFSLSVDLRITAASAAATKRTTAAQLCNLIAERTNSALPLLIDNQRLIARSYEVGEIDLA